MTLSPPVHLNRYQHFTRLMRDPAVEVIVSRYTSKFDQSRQSVLTMRPAQQPGRDVFVFLHGMDGDCGDAVVMKDLIAASGGVVVAPGGRGPAWVSDAFLADADQIIRAYAARYGRLFLVGISMGGTQALTLAAANLPKDTAAKLRGIIAFIPGADLPDIATNSANARVRITLDTSVGGDHAKLSDRSPAALVAKYPAGVPFAIAYNEADTVLPVAGTIEFIQGLARRGQPVVSYVMPGDHSFVIDHLDERIDYRRIMSDLGKHRPAAVPLPTRMGSSIHRKAS